MTKTKANRCITKAATSKTSATKRATPASAGRGLPGSWDEIAPGHLVIAQESLANGWWEAIVLDRKDDMLTLRFRDYPRLPRFFRHRTAVALMKSGRRESGQRSGLACRKRLGRRERPGPLPSSSWPTSSASLQFWRSDHGHERLRASAR